MSLAPLSSPIASAQTGVPSGSATSLAALNGQIRQVKQQLDDWTTCVSAKTTKGQAEIQRLSAQLSGVEDRAHRLAAVQTQVPTAASTHSIDVWA